MQTMKVCKIIIIIKRNEYFEYWNSSKWQRRREKNRKINYISKWWHTHTLIATLQTVSRTIIYHPLCPRRETCSFSYAKMSYSLKYPNLWGTVREREKKRAWEKYKRNRMEIKILWETFAKIHENLSTNIAYKRYRPFHSPFNILSM